MRRIGKTRIKLAEKLQQAMREFLKFPIVIYPEDFWIQEGHIVIHNGIVPRGEPISDTQTDFSKYILGTVCLIV